MIKIVSDSNNQTIIKSKTVTQGKISLLLTEQTREQIKNKNKIYKDRKNKIYKDRTGRIRRGTNRRDGMLRNKRRSKCCYSRPQ